MIKILSFLFFAVSMIPAQPTDSTIVFTSPEPTVKKQDHTTLDHAWGVDILLSNYGFGLAGFYRREYSRNLYGTVTFGIAESKDDNEVEYYDYYGQSYIPGKINRFLILPLLFGVQYRLFADDITDSFRPYANAGIGPTMVYVHPYADQNTGEQVEYFKSLGLARPHYTIGGYVGIGAFFGSDMGSLSGINIRYYYIPFSTGIESLQDPSPDRGITPGQIRKKKDFGGFFITINLGSAF